MTDLKRFAFPSPLTSKIFLSFILLPLNILVSSMAPAALAGTRYTWLLPPWPESQRTMLYQAGFRLPSSPGQQDAARKR